MMLPVLLDGSQHPHASDGDMAVLLALGGGHSMQLRAAVGTMSKLVRLIATAMRLRPQLPRFGALLGKIRCDTCCDASPSQLSFSMQVRLLSDRCLLLFKASDGCCLSFCLSIYIGAIMWSTSAFGSSGSE